jgi:molybdenum cofactor cytidylyltransferase
MRTVGLLLAAGQSRRFGDTDKLLAPYHGRALVSHAAEAMREAGLDGLVATVRDESVAALLEDFVLSRLGPDSLAQSGSLLAGCRDCLALRPDRILVVLGDMPHVTSEHLKAVVQRCQNGRPAASTDGSVRLPPACFPVSMASELMALSGDRGAGALLKTLPPSALVRAPAGMLKDIDLPGDLDASG